MVVQPYMKGFVKPLATGKLSHFMDNKKYYQIGVV